MALAQVAIAADLGGTFLRTGLVSPAKVLVHQASHRVGDRRGNTAVERLLREALREAYEKVLEQSLEPVGAGLAVPGLVDPGAGMIRYSANLNLRDLPVASIVREAVPLPVVVENDVRAAAWGEWMWGAGQGTRYMTYLSAGTGIAAAAICDGRLYHGATGAAGEIGHTPVIPDGDLCRCGHRGCLETVAGGWGIARRAGVPTTEAVFEAAAKGDPAAITAIKEAGQFLGRAAVAAVRLWNPEVLVLGGGLLFDGSPLMEVVRESVTRNALYGEVPPAVHPAVFGGRSGLMGAACLVLAAG